MGRRSDGDDPLSAAPPALSIDDFAAWVGSEFQIGDDALRLPMTLSAAEPLDGSPRATGGFRLEFTGPSDPVLQQAIMSVAGPGRAHDIFLVPIGRDTRGTRYEAVFY